MKFICQLLIPITATLLFTGCDQQSDAPSDKEPLTSQAPITTVIPTAELDEPGLRKRIETLASDEFGGRAPATSGGEKTRQYLIDEMQKIGLKPGNGESYEQSVPLVELTADPNRSEFSINGTQLGYGNEIVFWTKRIEENVSFSDSELIFVGYGIVAPEFGWNDYEGIDVKGKTVVTLVNDPGYATQDPELFNGSSMTYYGRWTYKFEEAARQGAAAAIIIHQTEPASYGWGVIEGSWTGPQLDLKRIDGGANRVSMEAWLHENVARSLFSDAGLDFDAQLTAAATPEFSATPMSGLIASGTITSNIRQNESANVAGVLPGTKRPDEYVLYMAHWDHLGRNFLAASDSISNGAVDNATGTAGILSIAEAFAANETPPERSVLFLAVTAEESGLLGSAYFAEDPFVPLANIVGGVNIDALLPTPPVRDLIVIGNGASELEDLLQASAEKRELHLSPDSSPQSGFFYRSDHISLAKTGVPMLYAKNGLDLIDGGLEAGKAIAADYRANRYHKPSDEYEQGWDMRAVVQTFEILYEVGAAMAYTNDWPNWYEGNEFRAIRDQQRAEAESTE